MRRVSLFVEDYAHEMVIGHLMGRMAREFGIPIIMDKRSVRRGYGTVIRELKQFLRDIRREKDGYSDLVVVATDANCKGMRERLKEIYGVTEGKPQRIVCAVPDPHIERWLLLDSAAFKTVFGRGCEAPDQKCERNRYKKSLVDNILSAGISPSIGGIEYSEDLVEAMNLERTARNDVSFNYFFKELRVVFNEWKA
jgi:hypothetical protein